MRSGNASDSPPLEKSDSPWLMEHRSPGLSPSAILRSPSDTVTRQSYSATRTTPGPARRRDTREPGPRIRSVPSHPASDANVADEIVNEFIDGRGAACCAPTPHD